MAYSNTVVVIPYRDRTEHLDHFIKHSVPALKEGMPGVTVAVIEQANSKPFNRGAVLNAGFKIFQHCDWFIRNDVDICPTKKAVTEMYSRVPDENLAIGIFSYNGGIGGATRVSRKFLEDTNGFPNDYWGYGAEDIALRHRADFVGKRVEYIHGNVATVSSEHFTRFDHPRPDRSQNNVHLRRCEKWKALSPEAKRAEMKANGISSLDLKIVSRTSYAGIEHIKVDF